MVSRAREDQEGSHRDNLLVLGWQWPSQSRRVYQRRRHCYISQQVPCTNTRAAWNEHRQHDVHQGGLPRHAIDLITNVPGRPDNPARMLRDSCHADVSTTHSTTSSSTRQEESPDHCSTLTSTTMSASWPTPPRKRTRVTQAKSSSDRGTTASSTYVSD